MNRGMLALPRAADITQRFAMLPCPATATLSVQYYTALSLTYSGGKIAVVDLGQEAPRTRSESFSDYMRRIRAWARAYDRQASGRSPQELEVLYNDVLPDDLDL